MRRIGSMRARIALTIAATLPLLAGCWWLGSEPGPGEWRVRSGSIADSRPHHVASLFESGGFGQLLMECTMGPIDFRIASGRDSVIEHLSGLPVRYRFDGNPPVAIRVSSDRRYLRFRDPAQATGEDPMVRQIEAAQQLTIRIDWSPDDRQMMRFDVSRARPAMDELRRACAEAGRRFGATS
jgi:hypothetical protein